jgi:hypothetical protein
METCRDYGRLTVPYTDAMQSVLLQKISAGNITPVCQQPCEQFLTNFQELSKCSICLSEKAHAEERKAKGCDFCLTVVAPVFAHLGHSTTLPNTTQLSAYYQAPEAVNKAWQATPQCERGVQIKQACYDQSLIPLLAPPETPKDSSSRNITKEIISFLFLILVCMAIVTYFYWPFIKERWDAWRRRIPHSSVTPL